MGITVKRSGDSCCMTVAGGLNIYTALASWQQLHEGMAEANAVKVDLSAVSELDTSGVRW